MSGESIKVCCRFRKEMTGDVNTIFLILGLWIRWLGVQRWECRNQVEGQEMDLRLHP